MVSRRLMIWGVGAVLLALVLVFGLASRHPKRSSAPALPGQTLSASGPAVTLASLKGKPVLVTFWASWCDPCAEEATALEGFARKLHGTAALVGVDWEDGLSGGRSFVRRYRWSFPVLRDAEGTVGERYGFTSLPTTYVIDTSGRIRETLRGPQTEQSLTRALRALRS